MDKQHVFDNRNIVNHKHKRYNPDWNKELGLPNVMCVHPECWYYAKPVPKKELQKVFARGIIRCPISFKNIIKLIKLTIT